MKNNSLENVISLLKESDNILVLGHMNPDGDAIGSSRALALSLKKLGKNVATSYGGDPFSTDTNPMTLPESWDWLAGAETYISANDINPSDYDLLVTCDTATRGRMGTLGYLLEEIEENLVIDHHPPQDPYGKLHYIFPEEAAACSIVSEVIKALGVEFDKDIANLLLFGLSTDTGRFSHASTRAKDHYLAGELMEAGADCDMVTQIAYMSNPKEVLALAGRLLSRIIIEDDVIITYALLSDGEELGVDISESDFVIEQLRSVTGVDITVLMKQSDNGRWRCSFRSRGEANVATIARMLDGGGHIRAAGATFAAESVEAAIDMIRAVIAKEKEARSATANV